MSTTTIPDPDKLKSEWATNGFRLTVHTREKEHFLKVSKTIAIEHRMEKNTETPELITFKFKGGLLELACSIQPYYEAGLPFSVSNFDY